MTILCPKCKSEDVVIGQKGFGVGRAAVGLVVLGPFGLAAGLLGRKKIECTCAKCQHRWLAKKQK